MLHNPHVRIADKKRRPRSLLQFATIPGELRAAFKLACQTNGGFTQVEVVEALMRLYVAKPKCVKPVHRGHWTARRKT